MKYGTIILIFILSLCNFAKAQNLVPNGNFEIYDTCPNDISQITYAVKWYNAQPNTSPDYFNTCNSYANVPNTIFGYQKDCCGGNGIAGIYTFNKSFPSKANDYIQVMLTDTLKAGRKYLASMYVNACDVYNYAIATIGMYFTNLSMPWPTNVGFINQPNPQIKNTTLLNDTLNWLVVQDTFIAQGGEVYLTIGNFSYDFLSDTVKVYHMGFGTSNDNAYYYIDGVSVYDITSSTCNNYWDAGFNKHITTGDSIGLGAINTDNSTFSWVNSLGGSTYLSSNNCASPLAKPIVTTTYYVTKTCPNNNVFKDTVTVYVQQTVSINQIINNNIKINIYPNPSNGNLYVQYNLKQDALLEITDINNKIVGRYNLPASLDIFNISNGNLENGIYFYHVVGDKNYIDTGKIIIMK